MRNFNKKKNGFDFSKNFFSIFFSFIVFFIIALLIISTIKIYQKRTDLEDQIRDKEEEIAELSEKIKSIGWFEEDDFDDDYHLEKIAREQLLLKKEGEEVVFITLPEKEEEKEKEKEEKNKLILIKNIIIEKVSDFFGK